MTQETSNSTTQTDLTDLLSTDGGQPGGDTSDGVDSNEPNGSDPTPEPPTESRDLEEEAVAVTRSDSSAYVPVVNVGGSNSSESDSNDPHSSTSHPETTSDITPGASQIDPTEYDADWLKYFPDGQTPYPEQIDGIQEALATFSKQGYQLIEGACGTGKTRIALIAALHAIRDTPAADETLEIETPMPDFKRVLAVTSVKQQLRQFVEEVRDLNAQLDIDGGDAPVKGLVLRGKGDLVPYARERMGPYNSNDDSQESSPDLQDVSSDLRETTAHIIKAGSQFPLKWPHDLQPTGGRDDVGDSPEDGPWYDENRAKAIARLIENVRGDRFSTAGVESPYPNEVIAAEDLADTSRLAGDTIPSKFQGYVDPFYAGALGYSGSVSFTDGAGYMLDGDALVEACVSRGLCPHTVMSDLLEDADAVIGNYYHLFDPDTRELTEKILTPETLAVVDEAHMVEDRTRDALSDRISIYDLRQAWNDIDMALTMLAANGNGPGEVDETGTPVHEQARLAMDGADMNVSKRDLERAMEFMQWLMGQINDVVVDYLDDEYGDWETVLEGNRGGYDQEVPLQEPDSDKPDILSKQSIVAEDFTTPEIWTTVSQAGAVAAAIHDVVAGHERQTVVDNVSYILGRWWQESNTEYFREIQLEHSPKEDGADSTLPDWTGVYNADLYLYNCIPSDRLAETFDRLGGGILMSATLEPFEIFKVATGMDQLETGLNSSHDGDLEESTPETREISSSTYGMTFPRDNRASWVVDAPQYTYKNRGDIVDSRDQMTQTREQYLDVILDIGASHGNILLTMPNYREAEWAADQLKAAAGIDKRVLQDESSTATETENLLQRFFEADEHQILVTSTLGTLTEGVDYPGEKLHTCAVVGVPYPYMNEKHKAVQQAYEDRFADYPFDGFDTAAKIPSVRKARQAIGRVIRGESDRGTRIFVDERYADDGFFGVNEYLSQQERAEFTAIHSRELRDNLHQFWK